MLAAAGDEIALLDAKALTSKQKEVKDAAIRFWSTHVSAKLELQQFVRQHIHGAQIPGVWIPGRAGRWVWGRWVWGARMQCEG